MNAIVAGARTLFAWLASVPFYAWILIVVWSLLALIVFQIVLISLELRRRTVAREALRNRIKWWHVS